MQTSLFIDFAMIKYMKFSFTLKVFTTKKVQDSKLIHLGVGCTVSMNNCDKRKETRNTQKYNKNGKCECSRARF